MGVNRKEPFTKEGQRPTLSGHVEAPSKNKNRHIIKAFWREERSSWLSIPELCCFQSKITLPMSLVNMQICHPAPSVSASSAESCQSRVLILSGQAILRDQVRQECKGLNILTQYWTTLMGRTCSKLPARWAKALPGLSHSLLLPLSHPASSPFHPRFDL